MTAPRPDHRIRAGLAQAPAAVDLVVIGLGATGAGVALDAATRGLDVLAVDAHDLAYGTSRWSSKLVHGGLRYLARGQLGVAHESAVERGILMETTAPHLTHALPIVLPLHRAVSPAMGALTRAGLRGGDLLRRAARTATETLPAPRRITATEAMHLAPPLRQSGLRGGLLSWDGQLEDDARLVVTLARTAVAYGADMRTRARVVSATGRQVVLRDELSGATHVVQARSVINATGVWAGTLTDDVRLRPSRGSHLVLREEALPDLSVGIFAPVPGTRNRFVMVLPQPDGTRYVGLTDEAVDGPLPDVPTASNGEIRFLLDVASGVLERPLGHDDVAGTFAGLRPLLDTGTAGTADLSRRHAVLDGADGMVTVVGGKLTTYRRMAQDAVDAAVASAGLDAGPCRSDTTPLLGAAPRAELATISGPARLVRRFGTEADLVLGTAHQVTGLSTDELLEPLSSQVPTTLAELVFGATHEGAHDAADLVDRRTRAGLIPADRPQATAQADRALALTGTFEHRR